MKPLLILFERSFQEKKQKKYETTQVQNTPYLPGLTSNIFSHVYWYPNKPGRTSSFIPFFTEGENFFVSSKIFIDALKKEDF